MIKEIKYGGITASPSDYESPDGDLAAVVGSVPEDGSLSPVLPPRLVFQVEDGSTVCFVHETAYIRNYILRSSDNEFTWRNESGDNTGELPHEFSSTQTIHQVNAIGNTIVILADDGIHYFLWKGSNDGYLYLGTHMPELEMNFGLQGYMETSGSSVDLKLYNVTESIVETESTLGGDREGHNNIDIATEGVLAKANDFIASGHSESHTGKKRSMFIFPFLVRYAYRLYDGTCVMHSAPILMPCAIGPAIQCNVSYFGQSPSESSPNYNYSTSYIHGIVHDLDYCTTQESKTKLEEWSDIIKSVDIFVSRQFYTYDQNGKVTRYLKNEHSKSYSFCHLSKGTAIGNEFPNNYQRYENQLVFLGSNTYEGYSLSVPQREAKDVLDEIKMCHSFYFLHSIDIKNLKTARTVIPIEEGYLNSIELKEEMTDDYNSHNSIIPKYCYDYNSRLTLTGIKSKLFKGFDPGNALQFSDRYNDVDYSSRSYTGYSKSIRIDITYLVKQDNKNIVFSTEKKWLAKNSPILYLYHPNRNVYKAIVCITDGTGLTSKYYELPMDPHDTLNGSIFFEGLDFDIYAGKYEYTGDVPNSTQESLNYIEERNKTYTSEVNNPFYFPVLGINTIGTGEIYSIRSAAKALSQGQFGQFPLYAFTSEGVWALEVGSDGSFTAKQPITRDVCINADSITQLDSSVLFATDRGIMLLSGSDSTCITDSLDYQQIFDISTLPHIDDLIDIAGVADGTLEYDSLHDFLLRCRILYAYNLQRIIVYSTKADGTSYPYAYVYSLKSKSWGMMPSSIASSVPSYPEALAMLEDGSLVDFSNNTTDTTQLKTKGMLITRPLKLDLPDVMKTIDTIIQRGNFKYGHVKSALYGSRDLVNWAIVWTSTDHYMRGFRSTPHKYFRIVSIYELDPTESLYGASIQFTPKYQNRLR